MILGGSQVQSVLIHGTQDIQSNAKRTFSVDSLPQERFTTIKWLLKEMECVKFLSLIPFRKFYLTIITIYVIIIIT